LKIALYCPNKPLHDPDPSGDRTIAQGIRQALENLGHDCREMSTFRARWFWKTGTGWRQALLELWPTWYRARRFRPQLWLTYHTYYKSPDVLGPIISRLCRIPYVLFQPMYGTRRRKDPATRLGFYLNRFAVRSAAHAFTNNLLDVPALHRALAQDRVTYVAPGIFPEDFQRDAEAGLAVRLRYGIGPDLPLIMSAARFRPGVKSQSLIYLFHALAPLVREGVVFQLLLVGDGPMQDVLQELADRLLPGRVIFTGGVRRQDMPSYYSAADLFVFPGIGESLGMVYLEAQACGLPVVALDTGGVPQVVRRGETALLVTDDGGAALTAAVRRLIADSALRRRLAANGPRFIKEERNLHHNYATLAHGLENARTEAAGAGARH
jgi:glycosyltransferase involved in cell wall biosynthesis